MWTEILFSHPALLKYSLNIFLIASSQLRVQKFVAGTSHLTARHRIQDIVKPVHWMKDINEEVVDITAASTELYKLYRSVCLEELHIRVCSSLKENQFLSDIMVSVKACMNDIKKEQTALRYQTANNHRHQIHVVRVSCKTVNCHRETMVWEVAMDYLHK